MNAFEFFRLLDSTLDGVCCVMAVAVRCDEGIQVHSRTHTHTHSYTHVHTRTHTLLHAMYTTGDAENYMLSMFMSIDKNYSGVIDLRELLAVMVRGEHTVHSTHSTRSTRTTCRA